jgi:cytochrome c biogenesis protein CcmG/thiol:disulfide interchange protein DsbE
MSGWRVILAGLLAGIVVGAVLLGALVAFLPDSAVPTPGPTPAPSNTSPPATPAPSGGGATGAPSGAGSTRSPDDGGPFMIGRPAPPLVVPLLGGGGIDLASLRGQPVWVNFMATYCPPCRDELPVMNGFAARYAETELVVLAVDVREAEDVVGPYAESLGLLFPVALDEDGAAQRAWGALALPVHYWIDVDGIVRDGALGGIGPDLMAAGLRAILPGVTVEP